MRVNRYILDERLSKQATCIIPSFEVGQNIRVALGIEDNRKLVIQKRINGKIVFKSKKLITVQCEHYKESINIIDFMTGQARLIQAR